jgi:hypothetical protein
MNGLMTGCRFVVLGAVLWLTSCTFESSQFDMLASAFSPKHDELAAYRWRVEFDGYRADVLAATTPDGTLFVNSNDDLIAFDGWVVTEVHGLGLTSDITVQGRVGKRLIKQGSNRVDTQRCEEWRLVQQGHSTVQEQDCVGVGRYRNRITVDVNGAIVRIEQHLGFKEFGDNSAITLIKL